MRPAGTAILTLLVAIPLFSQNAVPFPGGYRFTEFATPGFPDFRVTGLNDNGDIVGYYTGPGGRAIGLLRSANGAFTPIDVPGSVRVEPHGINNAGQIVGEQAPSPNSVPVPFLRQPDGTMMPVTLPGAEVRIYGINNAGRMVGGYGSRSLILDPDGNFTLFDVPFRDPAGTAYPSWGLGINDLGEIVGLYSLGPRWQKCFHRDAAGRITEIEGCAGINNGGWRVGGVYADNIFRNIGHGAVAINNAGQIAGNRNPGLAAVGAPFVGTPCPTAITPMSQSISAVGGNITVGVTAAPDCQWGSMSGGYLVQVAPESGSGNGTVVLQVPANTESTSARSMLMVVAGQLFTINQGGASCSYSIAPPSAAITAGGSTGGAFSVNAPAGCPWTATANVPWITIAQGVSGNGNGSVVYNVAANPGATSRTGTITAGGRTFFVNQSAGPFCTFALSTWEPLSPYGGRGVIRVTANGSACSWTATSDANWLTFPEGNSGTGSGDLLFQYNPGGTGLANVRVGGSQIALSQGYAPGVSSPGSVIPNNGSGTGGTFRFQFRLDPANPGARAQMAFASFGCLVYYGRLANTLQLLSDSNAWLGPLRPGASGTLQNSRCTLHAAQSSATFTAEEMTVDVALTFASSLAGSIIDIRAESFPSVAAGYLQLGYFRVTTGLPPPVTGPLGITPSAGSGTGETFQVQTNTGFPVERVQILINDTLRADGACLVYYNAVNRTAALVNDGGTAYGASAPLGGAGVIENNFCILDLARSYATGAGSAVTLYLALSFRGSFSGPKGIFGEFLAGMPSSGYQRLGSYTVTSPTNAPAVQVTPEPGALPRALFRYQFNNPGGASSIIRTQMLVHSSLRGDRGCLVYFDNASRTVQLLDDQGAGWLGPVALGAASNLANSQCMVDTIRSSASAAGNTLTVELAIIFTPAFAGPRRIFAEQYPVNGATSGYYLIGTHQVGSGAGLSVLGMTPNAGRGGLFRFDFESIAGAADIARTQMLFAGSRGNAGACLIYYTREQNTVMLLDDGGTAWMGPVVLGSSGMLQNSQCMVYAAGSSSAASGNRLSVALQLSFSPAFSGAHPVSAEAYSSSFLASTGYVPTGTWTVP